MRAFAAWLVLCVVWSSTWMVIKLGLLDLPPLFFAGVRFVIAFAAIAIIVCFRKTPLPAAKDWWLIALTGVLTFGVNYGCLFWGEQHIASGLAAILQATIPAFGMVFAHYHLPHERITLLKATGVTLGLAGVAVIFSDKIHTSEPLAGWGCAAIVAGALSVSYANVLVKARGGHLPPMTLAAGQMLCGLIPLLVASFFLEGGWTTLHWTSRAVFSLLYLALVGSALTFCLLYWLLRHTEVTKIMMISLITPVAAVALGMVYLDEKLSWRIGVGTICVLMGISLVINPFRRTVPLPLEEAAL